MTQLSLMRCIAKELAGSFHKPGVTVGTPTVAPVSFPALGDQSADYRITVPVSASGLTTSVITDALALRVGNGVAAIVGVNYDDPVDSTLMLDLAHKIVNRGRVASATT